MCGFRSKCRLKKFSAHRSSGLWRRKKAATFWSPPALSTHPCTRLRCSPVLSTGSQVQLFTPSYLGACLRGQAYAPDLAELVAGHAPCAEAEDRNCTDTMQDGFGADALPSPPSRESADRTAEGAAALGGLEADTTAWIACQARIRHLQPLSRCRVMLSQVPNHLSHLAGIDHSYHLSPWGWCPLLPAHAFCKTRIMLRLPVASQHNLYVALLSHCAFAQHLAFLAVRAMPQMRHRQGLAGLLAQSPLSPDAHCAN